LEHLAAYVHPGVLLALAPQPCVDYTVAVHHFLVADLHHCTLCGGRPQVLDQVLARRDAMGIAVVYCLPCRAADTDRERLRAKLAARYDAAGCGPNDVGVPHG
jgi:hypothetical protein